MSTDGLLGLPVELRQRIFEYVLAAPPKTGFPPRKQSSGARRSLGMKSPDAANHGTSFSESVVRSAYLSTLLVCRQIHDETQLMPFAVNTVDCPATFGSNTSATKQFLETLTPIQRYAIRDMELSLLASIVEAWTLSSLFVAGPTQTQVNQARGDKESVEKNLPDEAGVNGKSPSTTTNAPRSNLHSLTVHISTRDLYLAGAESLAGLMHMLTIGSTPGSSAASGSWMTDGLVHLASLRRLTIVVEMSGLVAEQVSSSQRSQFEQAIRESLPRVGKVVIQWKEAPRSMNPSIDDPEWLDCSWLPPPVPMITYYEQTLIEANGVGPAYRNVRPGFACWVAIAS